MLSAIDGIGRIGVATGAKFSLKGGIIIGCCSFSGTKGNYTTDQFSSSSSKFIHSVCLLLPHIASHEFQEKDTIYLSNSFDITKYIDTRRFCIVWTYIVIEQSVRGLSSAIRAKLMIVYYRVSTI
ncbi:hypothetical protein DTO166G4_3696 [Paecilomyces variotii]|nr:hypothetical protein DTO166G4_3696 [Paecilomyces variotii]KAJ9230679.1 hypothetical protein DTO166G5_7192 [Paecilomyces variotii]KAJ9255939.1 hypothetical protein DTO195F2_6143 [Paecilomyces variotii]KAJ9350559.1 hypothetical protein DTO280E4_8639 [Paecilomyces variotii]KAJ9368094.1 hypothetical protein DTO282E5_7210 [Paecilomyces variotii]